MSGFQFILTPAGRAAMINAENTGTNAVLIHRIGLSDSAAGIVGGALTGERKRVATFAGAAVADDMIHITIRDDTADAYSLRAFALYLEDGTLFGWYAQADVILEKSPKAMLLLAGDILITQANATTLIFNETNWINPVATTTTMGVLRLSTSAETIAGAATDAAVTPAALKAALDGRFGIGAPSAFVKSLLALTTAALIRAALELKGAAQYDMGEGNNLDADKLDGQHGSYYLAWANLSGKPGVFPPEGHGHAWGDIVNPPSTATRWPAWNEVTDKPGSFPPAAHVHAAADITSGVFNVARISEGSVTQHQAALQISWNQLTNRPDYVLRSGDTISGTLRVVSDDALQLRPTAAVGAASRLTFQDATGVRRALIGQTPSNNTLSILAYKTDGSTVDSSITLGVGQVDVLGSLNVSSRVATGGATACLQLDQRDNTPVKWLWYANAGAMRLFITSDILTISNTGALWCAGGFDFGSSRKLKQIDGPMPYGLAEVERIITLIGRYKPEYNQDGRTRLFFDAEQFAEIMPEAVDLEAVEFDGERVAAIKLDQVMPPAYRAIAELAAMVRQLREEVSLLRVAQ